MRDWDAHGEPRGRHLRLPGDVQLQPEQHLQRVLQRQLGQLLRRRRQLPEHRLLDRGPARDGPLAQRALLQRQRPRRLRRGQRGQLRHVHQRQPDRRAELLRDRLPRAHRPEHPPVLRRQQPRLPRRRPRRRRGAHGRLLEVAHEPQEHPRGGGGRRDRQHAVQLVDERLQRHPDQDDHRDPHPDARRRRREHQQRHPQLGRHRRGLRRPGLPGLPAGLHLLHQRHRAGEHPERGGAVHRERRHRGEHQPAR
jgi:hypothetical protein